MKSLRFRLTAGLAAQSCSQAVTIGIQLVSVPILITAWGLESYGVWLLISAIPTYLALADLGFAQVGASDMTMRVARGDRAGAQATFHTVFMMNCILGLAGLAVMLGIAFSPLSLALVGHGHLTPDVRLAMALLSAHVFLVLMQGVIGAGMRSEGAFALMAFTFAIVRFLDAFAVIAAAVLGGDLLDAALAMLGSRLTATLLVAVLVRRRWPWLALGFGEASAEKARHMLGPSLHYSGYTVGSLVSIQGATIAIGAALGPTAVAVTSTARTLARLGVTASTMLNSALLPEYSANFGRNQGAAFRRLFAFHFGAMVAAMLAYLALMLPLGPLFYAFWTKNAVTLPPLLFTLLALGSALDMIWTTLQTPAVSANHLRLTGICYLLASLAGVTVLLLFARLEGAVLFGWVAFGISATMIGAAILEYRALKPVLEEMT